MRCPTAPLGGGAAGGGVCCEDDDSSTEKTDPDASAGSSRRCWELRRKGWFADGDLMFCAAGCSSVAPSFAPLPRFSGDNATFTTARMVLLLLLLLPTLEGEGKLS